MDCHSICFKKETCTSFFPTIKNHQTSPYICKQCTYTTNALIPLTIINSTIINTHKRTLTKASYIKKV